MAVKGNLDAHVVRELKGSADCGHDDRLPQAKRTHHCPGAFSKRGLPEIQNYVARGEVSVEILKRLVPHEPDAILQSKIADAFVKRHLRMRFSQNQGAGHRARRPTNP